MKTVPSRFRMGDHVLIFCLGLCFIDSLEKHSYCENVFGLISSYPERKTFGNHIYS